MRGLTPLEFETLGLATNGDCVRSFSGPWLHVPTGRDLIKRGLLEFRPCTQSTCKAKAHLYHTVLGKIALRTLKPNM